MKPPFDRTVCACEGCRTPCRVMPGFIAPGDAARMAGHLGVTEAQIEEKLLASPGARVGKFEGSELKTFRIHTIVPARKEDGSCVFLQGDGKCSVHPVSPFGCSYFDWHMGRDEGDRRSAWGLRQIMGSMEYAEMWRRLDDAGRVSEPPEVLRKRFDKPEVRRKKCR